VVMSGRITAITPAKRCSIIWAVEFAASRPQAERGVARVCVLSIFANGFHLDDNDKLDQ
jgi:hypothetical protein